MSLEIANLQLNQIIMKFLNLMLILFSSFLAGAQTKNVSRTDEFPNGWMAIGSTGTNSNKIWTIQNLNSAISGSELNVVSLHNLPPGWVITKIDKNNQGSQFEETRWSILNANGYSAGTTIVVVSMKNVDPAIWKKMDSEVGPISNTRFKLQNIGSNNSSSSSDDGFIADEDRPKFIPYTPNTPEQIAKHNAKVARDRENAWLAGQSDFYFYSTVPKKFLVFVYQLQPLNQTPFPNDQVAGKIVPPLFIRSDMVFNKLVLARAIERYFPAEPTMRDVQDHEMIWAKLENRFKYRIYAVSQDENLVQEWDLKPIRSNSNNLVNVGMSNPKSFPAPPKINVYTPDFSSPEVAAKQLGSTVSLMDSHSPTILYNHDYQFESEVILRIKFDNIKDYQVPPQVYVLAEKYEKSNGQQKSSYLLSTGNEVSITGNYFSVICLQENSGVKIAYQIAIKDSK